MIGGLRFACVTDVSFLLISRVHHLRKSCKRACKPYVSVSVRALVSDACQNSGQYFRQRKRKRSLTRILHRLLEFRKRECYHLATSKYSTIFFTCYVPSYERLQKSVVAYEERWPLTLALALTRTRCFVSVSASASLLEMISQASLQASLVTKKFVSDEP